MASSCVRTADIGIEHGFQLSRPRAAEDLVDDPRFAQIDMRRMDHRDALPLRPEVPNDQGEKAENAAGALEGLDGRKLRVQELQESRMKGVMRLDAAQVIGPHRLVGQRRGAARVELAIPFGGGIGCGRVDCSEQALRENARELDGLNRHHRGRVTRDDALRIAGSPFGDRLRLGFADLGPPDLRKQADDVPRLPRESVRLAGERDDDNEPAMRARPAVQREQEGRQLLGPVGACCLEAGGVLRELIEQHEGLATLEHGVEIGRTRRRSGGCVLADRLVERFAANLEGDLAPDEVLKLLEKGLGCTLA